MIFKKITVLIILAIFMILNCSKIEEEQPFTSAEQKKFPDQESWESTITMTKEGKRFAEVWAGYIAVYNSENITILKDSIHADFFDKNGNHNSVLTADSGIVMNNTNNLSAFGNVVVISDSGIVLESEELNWDNEKQKIISNVEVRFTTADDTLIGDSFISNPDLTNYEIENARGYSRRKIPITK